MIRGRINCKNCFRFFVGCVIWSVTSLWLGPSVGWSVGWLGVLGSLIISWKGMQRLRFHVPIGYFILSIPEVGIYKRKQECKKTRKQELDQASDQENKKTRIRPRKWQRKNLSFFMNNFLGRVLDFFLVFLIAFLVEFLFSFFLDRLLGRVLVLLFSFQNSHLCLFRNVSNLGGGHAGMPRIVKICPSYSHASFSVLVKLGQIIWCGAYLLEPRNLLPNSFCPFPLSLGLSQA